MASLTQPLILHEPQTEPTSQSILSALLTLSGEFLSLLDLLTLWSLRCKTPDPCLVLPSRHTPWLTLCLSVCGPVCSVCSHPHSVEWQSLKRFGVSFCSNITTLKNIFRFLSEVARELGTNCCAGQRQMLERFLPYRVQKSSFTS